MTEEEILKTELGKRIKNLRKTKGWTLKKLSQESDLSISFLSQLERGQTSATIYSLKSLADSLGVELALFFESMEAHRSPIVRSYEKKGFRLERSNFIYYRLASDFEGRLLDPMIVNLLPEERKEIWPLSHKGEEFVYVLEGRLTVFIEKEKYELFPGDSIHIKSNVPHNWTNYTNNIVTLLSVNTPVFL